MIRYFAAMDHSSYGKIAIAYCDAMVALKVPMRLLGSGIANLQIDDSGRETSRWARHRDLLLVPVTHPYINVVCCEPEFWDKFYTPPVVRRKHPKNRDEFEDRSTGCVRNVLICTSLHGPKDVARKYEVILHTQSLATMEAIEKRLTELGKRTRGKVPQVEWDEAVVKAIREESDLASLQIDTGLASALRMP